MKAEKVCIYVFSSLQMTFLSALRIKRNLHKKSFLNYTHRRYLLCITKMKIWFCWIFHKWNDFSIKVEARNEIEDCTIYIHFKYCKQIKEVFRKVSKKLHKNWKLFWEPFCIMICNTLISIKSCFRFSRKVTQSMFFAKRNSLLGC